MIKKGFLETATAEEFLGLIEDVQFVPFDHGFLVTWQAHEIGFGELTFYMKDGKMLLNTEYMPQNFVEAVMIKLARTVKRFDQ